VNSVTDRMGDTTEDRPAAEAAEAPLAAEATEVQPVAEATEVQPVAEAEAPAAGAVAGDPGSAPGDPGLAAERDRLARSLRETRLQLAMTQARLAALERSATMELGRTLVRAARRPWSRGVQLPADLVRLWRERGGLTGPGAATLALASAQLGDLAGVGERFLSALTAPGLGAPGASAGFCPPALVITGVLSARACATLGPDAAVYPLLPHDADVMLESTGADLVLIEAAAMLAGSAWAYAGDPAAADRGRRLGRLIAGARALGKPVIFVRNVPAHLAPGLDWVAASCDAVSDDDLGVQLARFNPVELAGSRPTDPVYADARDPREPPRVRALLDALDGTVRLTGQIPWRRQPALYREHAAFVTVSAAQAREQLACGARVIMAGGEPVAGALAPDSGSDWTVAALRDRVALTLADRPPTMTEILPVLRDIFAAHATPVRVARLARLAGLPDGLLAGRQVAVLAQLDDVSGAAALRASLVAQRMAPAELVVAAGPGLSVQAVTGALGELADRGVAIRVVPAGASWMPLAAAAARSPWVVPMRDCLSWHESYLLDLVCARECSQADVVGYGDAAYTFSTSLEPTLALARRDFFASGDPGHGLRLFSASHGD
jgi:hypothetical protein